MAALWHVLETHVLHRHTRTMCTKYVYFKNFNMSARKCPKKCLLLNLIIQHASVSAPSPKSVWYMLSVLILMWRLIFKFCLTHTIQIHINMYLHAQEIKRIFLCLKQMKSFKCFNMFFKGALQAQHPLNCSYTTFNTNESINPIISIISIFFKISDLRLPQRKRFTNL